MELRKKLAGASGGRDYIETVWARGYVLRELTVIETTIPAGDLGALQSATRAAF